MGLDMLSTEMVLVCEMGESVEEVLSEVGCGSRGGVCISQPKNIAFPIIAFPMIPFLWSGILAP